MVPSSLPVFSHVLAPSASFVRSSGSFHASLDDQFDTGYPDAVPWDLEVPILLLVPDSFRAEVRRMYSYIVDLFLQAAGFPSVAPPPHALFEDFFGQASAPPQPIHLNWFERVSMALSDADSRLAAVLASGSSDFSFLPSRSSHYAVRGDFAQGCAASVNPTLLALLECPLRPNLQLGLTIREAAALKAPCTL